MAYRAPDLMSRVQVKLAAGTWVPVCRANAERLVSLAHVEVQYKRFLREWSPLDELYVYRARTQFRARNRISRL